MLTGTPRFAALAAAALAALTASQALAQPGAGQPAMGNPSGCLGPFATREGVVKAANRYTSDVASAIFASRPGDNLVVAGTPVHLVSEMVFQGTAGSTHDELSRVLHHESPTMIPADIAARLGELVNDLRQGPKEDKYFKPPVLSIATAMFNDPRVSLESRFVGAVTGPLQATVRRLDFQDPATVGVINGWIKEATRGKIPSLLEKLSQDDFVVLASAAYFKGAWANAFEDWQDTDGEFVTASGERKPVRFMNQVEVAGYAETGEHQILRMDIANHSIDDQEYGPARFSAYLALPLRRDPAEGAAALERLGADELDETIRTRMEYKAGKISVPPFSIQSGIVDLIPVVSKLGAASLFGGGDLSGISKDGQVYISQFKTAATMDFTHDGLEAAGAAMAVGGLECCRHVPDPVFEFVADRPFKVYLRDNKTGLVLFEAYVRQP